jgi:hypothetical protein
LVGSDDEMTAFALGLDSKLKKGGVDPQSDEYYEKINSRMRQVFPINLMTGLKINQKRLRENLAMWLLPLRGAQGLRKLD